MWEDRLYNLFESENVRIPILPSMKGKDMRSVHDGNAFAIKTGSFKQNQIAQCGVWEGGLHEEI